MYLGAALALFLAGCGGSDSSYVYSGGGAPVPGGGGSFSYPNFSNSSRLTVVSTFQPSDVETTLTSSIVATVDRGFLGSLAQVSLPGTRTGANHSTSSLPACGTAEVGALLKLLDDETARSQSLPTDDSAIRARYEELPEGSQREFFLITGFRKVTAAKVLQPSETAHCTIFAELDTLGQPCISREKALAVAEAFDSQNPNRPGSGIYDQVRAAFGSEWNQNPVGGNDGDMKVVIMFFRSATLGSNLFGYTSPADESRQSSDWSNKGEIVYINADKEIGQNLSTLAHEFQHLINYNSKVAQQGTFPANAQDENVTINEGLSQISEDVCGFDLDHGNTLLVTMINNYLSEPEAYNFFDFYHKNLGYGQGYLFLRYVREHFGDETIRAIASGSRVGKDNLEANLGSVGLNEVFRRWAVANYASTLNGTIPMIYRYPSGFRTNGTYDAGQLNGPRVGNLTSGGTSYSSTLGSWGVGYQSLVGGLGGSVSLQVQVPGESTAGIVYEASSGTFSRFDQ